MADLKVNLVNSAGIKAPGAYSTIRVSRLCCGELRTLDISLRRTIRVPDNRTTYELPPDMGPFPIYNVKDFALKLPQPLVEKGGLFIPMYQREAMWIKFTCSYPFAVKVFAGGVNAVSGGKAQFGLRQMITRKQAAIDKAMSGQDYVVPPHQKWLDGVVTDNGNVKQFVADPVGSGYSIEAQVTGAENIAGIQFEITPKHLDSHVATIPSGLQAPISKIFVKTLTGKTLSFQVASCYTIQDIKNLIQGQEGAPTDQQRLVFPTLGSREDIDDMVISSLGIVDSQNLFLSLRLRGGWQDPSAPQQFPTKEMIEMALGAGGSIKQVIVKDEANPASWDENKTILLNLQLFDAIYFKRALGINPPDTPITAKTYANKGRPFFKLYEELSGIGGGFNVKSMGTLDEENGINSAHHEEEKDLTFRSVDIIRHGTSEVQLNTVDSKTDFVPREQLAIRLKQTTTMRNLGN